MTITEALPIALFILSVVFGLLGSVYLLIFCFSGIIRFVSNKKASAVLSKVPAPGSITDESVPSGSEPIYGGSMKLRNVDEQTAALIMAIISDESGIPSSELIIKSIRMIGEEQTKLSSKEAAL